MSWGKWGWSQMAGLTALRFQPWPLGPTSSVCRNLRPERTGSSCNWGNLQANGIARSRGALSAFHHLMPKNGLNCEWRKWPEMGCFALCQANSHPWGTVSTMSPCKKPATHQVSLAPVSTSVTQREGPIPPPLHPRVLGTRLWFLACSVVYVQLRLLWRVETWKRCSWGRAVMTGVSHLYGNSSWPYLI